MAKKKLTLEDVLVPKEEIPYEVPENWCWVKLGGIAEVKGGKRLPKGKSLLDEKTEYPYIRVADFDNGSINLEKVKYIDEETNESIKNYYINKEDVYISIAGTIGKVGIIPDVLDGANLTENAAKITNLNGVSNKYLYLVMQSEQIQYYIKESTVSTSQPKLALFRIKELPIPFPPLAEQERIVNRIESLFNKVDKAADLVDEARDGFEKRRAAILERAFSGELTKKWREENDFSVESIVANIEELNKAEKKKFAFSEASEIFDAPSNWKWMKLKDLCTKFKYGTSAKSQPEGSVPVLRMGNLQGGVIDWNNLVYTSNEDEIKKYDLVKGDLLFNRTNSPELVGKTSIYMGEREAIYAGYLIRIRTYEGVNSRYVNHFMNSTFAKARCYEVKTDGVSQSNINAEKLGDFDIPLPSIEEQNEIVRILDRLLDKERVIVEVSDVYDSIDVIKKSILAKAFRGELGSNDLGEESSIELLKNIIK